MEKALKTRKTKKNPKASSEEMRSPLTGILSGVAIAYAITCIAFILYALLLTYTEITERNLQLVVILTTVISVAVAGFDAARAAKERGWFWGLIAGLVYALVLIVISIIITKSTALGMGAIMIVAISLVGGAIGGMFGINSKK